MSDYLIGKIEPSLESAVFRVMINQQWRFPMGFISQSAQSIYSIFFPVTAVSNEIKKRYSPLSPTGQQNGFVEADLRFAAHKILNEKQEQTLLNSNPVFKLFVFFGKKFELKQNFYNLSYINSYVEKKENQYDNNNRMISIEDVAKEIILKKGYATQTLNRQAIQGALITAAAVGSVWYMTRKS